MSKEIEERNLELIWRKFNAYRDWPGVYFITSPQPPVKGGLQMPIRVKITEMSKDKNTKEIKILKLLPESKKEISFHDFENSHGKIFT